MPKRFISALIVFSLLFPDVARCGSFFGKEQPDTSEEEGERSHLTVQRRSIDSQDTPRAGQALRINEDPTPPQWSSIQGAEGTRGDPPKRHSTQITQTQQGHQTVCGQPKQDPDAFSFLSQDFQTVAQGLSLTEFIGGPPDGSDSDSIQIGNPSLLDEGGSGDEKSEKNSKGQVPVDGDSKEEEGQEGAGPTPEEIAQINDYNQQSWKQLTDVQKGSLTGGELRAFFNPTDEAGTSKRASLYDSSSPLVTSEKNKELEDLVLLPGNGAPSISPETEEFLRYVKVRVIDGKLNWKQILGIVGGMATGGFLGANIVIIFSKDVFESMKKLGIPIGTLEVVLLIAVMPVTFGLDAASRTSSLLIALLGDNTNFFSIQKSLRHRSALVLSKICFYAGAFGAGLLPAYYLYNGLCRFLSYGNYWLCSAKDPDQASALTYLVFGITCLVFDTTLHYGHQLAHHAQRWINDYFFRQMRASTGVSLAEDKRQIYLTAFKEQMKLIDQVSKNKLAKLYHKTFMNDANTSDSIPNLTVNQALKVLQEFQNFYHQHKAFLKPEVQASWKKTVASWVGWAGTFLASSGRHLVFWYAVDELLKSLPAHHGFPEGARLAISVILGGLIGGLIQGGIEYDAIKRTMYDMVGGRKISEPTSCGLLRRGMMAFNAVTGAISTLPYLFAGLSFARKAMWPSWARILVFVPFGFADALNNATAYHDSFLDILNAFENLRCRCCGLPSTNRQRDRLINVAYKIRHLFKELRPEVLEEVDQMLKDPQRTLQKDDLKMISLDGDEV